MLVPLFPVLQVVYDFVDSLEAVSTLHFSLATTYPRRVLGSEARGRTLQVCLPGLGSCGASC